MTKITDIQFLKNSQYKSGSNLDARQYLQYTFNTNKYNFYKWIFDQYDLPEKAFILELGCGMGDLWEQNKERIPASWDLTLTDISQSLIDITKSKIAHLPNNIAFLNVNATTLPFPSSSFNAVIANLMLYHVANRKQALSEIRKVLKPNGIFYTTTTGEKHMIELNELLNEFRSGLRLWDEASSKEFILENAEQQLSPYFEKIERRLYQDDLYVTEAQAIVNYILTTQAKDSLNKKDIEDLTTFVSEKVKSKPLHISKSLGMFISQG